MLESLGPSLEPSTCQAYSTIGRVAARWPAVRGTSSQLDLDSGELRRGEREGG
ncbi:Hypothetical protein A7982_04944 [Minicystis rosea]|nr:Hypothetical protein A7982_04944 [Minicystis rosea]